MNDGMFLEMYEASQIYVARLKFKWLLSLDSNENRVQLARAQRNKTLINFDR